MTNLGPGAYTVVFGLDGFTPSGRRVILGVDDMKSVNVALADRQRHRDGHGLGRGGGLEVGAKIGVNVSPDEVESLP